MRTGRASALTDTGRRRPQNEDTFVCDPPLFAVADGVGGAQAGEIASRLAAAALEERAPTLSARRRSPLSFARPTTVSTGTRSRIPPPRGWEPCHGAARRRGGRSVAIGHVGDSRAYLLRDDVLEQLTADHSLVGELVRAGQLSTEEAEQHPHRSVITRAVGTEPSVDVETLRSRRAPGDLYLICSDGLTDIVRDAEIAELILDRGKIRTRPPRRSSTRRTENGGIDNITVVLFEIVEGEPDPARGLRAERRQR